MHEKKKKKTLEKCFLRIIQATKKIQRCLGIMQIVIYF